MTAWLHSANAGCIVVLLLAVACGDASQSGGAAADSSAVPAPQAMSPAPAVDSAAAKLLPVDQADSSFRAFRQNALRAFARRDTSFLYRMLSPSIRISFGPDDGIAGFRDMWRMAEPDSPVWAALSRVLLLGGQLDDSTFIAPYVFAFWPDTLDAFEHIAVTSARAPVHATPERDSRVIGTMSHSILKVAEWIGMGESSVATDTSWVRVQLPNQEHAWLRATDVYSPVGWRAFFVRRDGRWWMVLFVAGD